MHALHHIMLLEGSETQGEPVEEERKRPGAGLGLSIILAAVFWAGVIATIVFV